MRSVSAHGRAEIERGSRWRRPRPACSEREVVVLRGRADQDARHDHAGQRDPADVRRAVHRHVAELRVRAGVVVEEAARHRVRRVARRYADQRGRVGRAVAVAALEHELAVERQAARVEVDADLRRSHRRASPRRPRSRAGRAGRSSESAPARALPASAATTSTPSTPSTSERMPESWRDSVPCARNTANVPIWHAARHARRPIARRSRPAETPRRSDAARADRSSTRATSDRHRRHRRDHRDHRDGHRRHRSHHRRRHRRRSHRRRHRHRSHHRRHDHRRHRPPPPPP